MTALITLTSMMNRLPLAGAKPAKTLLLQGSKRANKPPAQVARARPHATRTLLQLSARIRFPVHVLRRRQRNLRPALSPADTASTEPQALGSM